MVPLPFILKAYNIYFLLQVYIKKGKYVKYYNFCYEINKLKLSYI